MPETDSKDDEELLPTADLNDHGLDEEPVPDSRKFLCINEVHRLATPTLPSTACNSNPTPTAQPRCPSHTAQTTQLSRNSP